MSASHPMLHRLVAQARELYSLPRVAAEVLELTRDPQIDTRRLKECIENDPALACKLLRVVNSSLFGLSHSVRDLNQALALLGTTPLKLLVLGFCLPEGLFRGLGADFLARYWRKSLITAVAARQIAEDAWRMSGDEAFLAGLLRDVGLLVLLQDLGETYIHFTDRVQAAGGDLCAAERDALGFDHAELTGELLDSWKLPETLVAAARLPRHPHGFDRLPPTKRALPHILHLAGLLADLLAEGRADLLPELLVVGQKEHNLSPAQVEALVECLQTKVDQLAQILALDLPQGQNYRDVLSEAHQRLRSLATGAAGEMAAHGLEVDPVAAVWDETRALAAAAARAVELGTSRTAPSRSDFQSAKHGNESNSDAATNACSVFEPVQDEGLLARVATSAALCRQRRQPFSLLLVELDRYEEMLFFLGRAAADRLQAKIGAACGGLEVPQTIRVELSDGLFALLLPSADRQHAARAGGVLLNTVRGWTVKPAGPGAGLHLNIGVAGVDLPPKNFSARNFVAAAQRCLFAARAAGGQGVKSIEV